MVATKVSFKDGIFKEVELNNGIVTEETFDLILGFIRDCAEVAVDVETDGLKPWHGNKLCGVGVALDEKTGYYFPFRHPSDNLSLEYMDPLWDALYTVDSIIGYNLKFDLATLYQDGYRVPSTQRLVDCIVGARLCSANQFDDLSLSGQLEDKFGYEYREYDDQFKKYLKDHKLSKTFHLAPAEVVGEYCIGDVRRTMKLWDFYEEFTAETGQTEVWQQEQALTSVLWDMEVVGMGYDEEYGAKKIPQLKARINNLYNEIYVLAGKEFNIRSGKQLTEVMNGMGIHSPKKSPKTGKEMWGTGILLDLKEHPIAGKIMEVRGLEKLLGTYFEGIMAWPNAVVHCQHKNWGTITGRLSCTDPNLQNMAKSVQNLEGNDVDEETLAAISAFMGARQGESYTDMTSGSGNNSGGVTLGGMMAVSSGYTEADNTVSIRRIFVGRPEYRLYMIDYSQMEMRVFSDYVQDPELHAMLESADFDFHSHVANTVWNVYEDSKLWQFYRTLAKSINFGLIYGIGEKKLASQIQKSVAEARTYKEEYFARFPRAKTFIKQVSEVVESRGYIFNRFGRRYWIDPNRSYVGVNYLVQGTSADIVKNRMIACHKWLKENNCKSRILTQVHDELVLEIHYTEEDWVPFAIKKIMEERQISTLLPCDLSRGENSWAEKVKFDAKLGIFKGADA